MTISDIFDRYLGQPKPLKRLRVPTHTPLERLPMVAIDCETTGLDARRDRIVSIAAVRIADIPDAVATQASAPSSAASRSWNMATVGLVNRE